MLRCDDMAMERKTGVLMPLFSMRRVGDAGIGDLAALEEWVDWAAAHGVGFLQLLPVRGSCMRIRSSPQKMVR